MCKPNCIIRGRLWGFYMTIHRADRGPKLTIEVTEQERSAAKAAKKQFKKLLKQLDDALDLIFDFKASVVKEHPDQDSLHKTYRGRILRYRRKVQNTFNELLMSIQEHIKGLSSIMDSEMGNLRKLVLSEFDEISDLVESFLETLGETGREGFTQKLEKICTQLEQRKRSINDIIDEQLFNHLDTDILGRTKISSIKANIHKRIRLLRKLS